jgi:tetratricopeptide (TPR) repeat protein
MPAPPPGSRPRKRSYSTAIIVGSILLVLIIAGTLVRLLTAKKEPPPGVTAVETDPLTGAQLALHADKFSEAEKLFNQAIANDLDARRDSMLAIDRVQLAWFFRQTGRYDSAAAEFQAAIDLSHTSGGKSVEYEAKYSYAQLLFDERKFGQALSLGLDAATLGQLLSDWRGAYDALEVARRARHALGEFDEESALLDSLTALDQNWFGKKHAAEFPEKRFFCARGKSSAEDIRLWYNQWIANAEAANDTLATVRANLSWGEMKMAIGQRDSALHAFTPALTLLNFCNNDRLFERLLADLGDIALATGKIDQARRYFADAVDHAQAGGLRPHALTLKLQVIACEWKMERQKGRDSLYIARVDSVRRATPAGLHLQRAYAAFLSGRMSEHAEAYAAALKSYGEALDAYELAPGPNDDTLSTSLIDAFMAEEKSGWYTAPVSLNVELSNSNDAFLLCERRNLADMNRFFGDLTITTPSAETNKTIAIAQELRREDALLQTDIDAALCSGPLAGIDSVLAGLLLRREAEGTYRSYMRAENWTAIPRPIQILMLPQTLSVKELQDSLPRQSVLVQYEPLGSEVVALILMKDTTAFHPGRIDRTTLLDDIEEYDRLLASADSGGDPRVGAEANSRIRSLSDELRTGLVAPLSPVLGGANTVYIVDGPDMPWLPVHTLQALGNPATLLIAQRRLQYLPCASALLFARPADLVSEITALGERGHSDWDVEYELKDIRAFYRNAKMFFDTSVTLERFLAGGPDLLHVNAQFELHQRHADRSRFVFSDGASVSATRDASLGALFSMNAPQAVVFSNIAETHGDLARYAAAAFLAQGTRAFIATMWQGERKVHKDFGEAFYTALQSDVVPAEAYVRALRVLSSVHTASPENQWGEFYYYGK